VVKPVVFLVQVVSVHPGAARVGFREADLNATDAGPIRPFVGFVNAVIAQPAEDEVDVLAAQILLEQVKQFFGSVVNPELGTSPGRRNWPDRSSA
jgi:hypothetical protein